MSIPSSVCVRPLRRAHSQLGATGAYALGPSNGLTHGLNDTANTLLSQTATAQKQSAGFAWCTYWPGLKVERQMHRKGASILII